MKKKNLEKIKKSVFKTTNKIAAKPLAQARSVVSESSRSQPIRTKHIFYPLLYWNLLTLQKGVRVLQYILYHS